MIDLLIILALIFYLIDGYRRGFLLMAIELVGTILTFYVAFRWAEPVGNIVRSFISFNQSLVMPIGFFVAWVIFQLLYVGLTNFLYQMIPGIIRDSLPNKILGTLPSAAKGLVIIAIILTILVMLPMENQFRPMILNSRLGKPLVNQTQSIQQNLVTTYSDELTETFTFLTTTPLVRKTTSPNESIDLHFKTTTVTDDPTSESAILRLVNEERAKVGAKPLITNAALREVARAHARDMLARGYFSHVSPDGQDPFDRLAKANIRYLTAGENLAYAPTVDLAHIGLMNSPKHKENILYPEFGKVGIGVIDAKPYGKMFVQVFSN